MRKILSFILSVSMFMSISVKGEDTMRKNEIKNVSVHDPSIIKDNGKYYVFGSHITTAGSDDLINWDYVARGYQTPGNVHFGDLSETLKGSFKWAGEDDSDCKGGFAVWAPDVYYNAKYLWEDGSRGAYMMYYSASSTYKRSCIGLAVSRELEGPYTYVDTVIYSGFTKVSAKDEKSTHNKKYTNTNIDELINKGRVSSYKDDWGIDDYNNATYPNAIDPCVYEDEKGKLYLAYGSWSGGIFTLPINELTGLPVYPGFDGETEDGRMIDRYFGTHIAGGKGWSGEGPFVYYDEETKFYYLQTSYEWLGTDGGYHIRMFRSENPLGPFLDIVGNNAVYGDDMAKSGVKMFGNYYFESMDVPYTSGGHSSALIDDDGERYIFYHTRFKGTEHFQMRVHQMFMNEDGWPVIAPFRYMGSKISETGYTDVDVVGTYEFINHGNKIGQGGEVSMSRTVTLTSDGKIHGAADGYWTIDGKYCTFTLGGEIYKGVFFKQSNEKGEEVMTFSAVGGENMAVWGVKADRSVYSFKDYAMKITFDEKSENISFVKCKSDDDPYEDNTITPVYEEGVIGKAIKMDASYGVEVKGVDLSESKTVSFWVKPDVLPTFGPIVSSAESFHGEGVEKWFSLTTFTNGDDAVIWSRNAEKGQWLEAKNQDTFEIGEWQHITLVFDYNYYGGVEDALYCKLYVNGRCVATGSVAKGAMGRLFFGINPWDKPYSGLIDEVTVYNRALTHMDVLALYESYN